MKRPLQFLLRALLSTLLTASGAGFAETTADASPAAASDDTAASHDSAATRGESRLEGQRLLFLQTRELLRRGDIDGARQNMAALVDYPLYPYLELQRLTLGLGRRGVVADSADVDPAATGATDIDTTVAGAADTAKPEIDAFLRRHAGSLVAEQLRNDWLAILAHDERWREYLDYYAAEGIARTPPSKLQQCWKLEALYQTQQTALALQQTAELWLNTDLPDACDDPLGRWLNSAQRDEALVWQRFVLALDRRQEPLARYLAVNIREPYKLSAQYALLLYRDPSALENLLPQLSGQPEAGTVIVAALKNLAKRDADRATALWQQLRADGHLSAEQGNTARADIGRQVVAQRGVDALPWLLQYDPSGEDGYLLEWRVRLALPGGDWPRIAQWIEQLPPALAQTPRWTYWQARALAAQTDNAPQQQRATALFQQLARERGYYGFRAADQLKIAYQLNDQPLPQRAQPQPALSPALQRAREFHALREPAQARREWQYALRDMTAEQQQQAALLAEQWGWHDRAIQTATQSGAFNDLQLRFPLAYRDLMQRAAHDNALSTPWLFAIARQESTFMPDARSPVGALGIMQLMPDTAKQVARGLRTKVSSADLREPGPNIRLGGNYLGTMLNRYRGNRVLATAAYNGGPGRISGILKNQQRALPSDVWIETLPYRETREYVQNVLSFAVIYAQRLGLNKPLIESSEALIGGASAP